MKNRLQFFLIFVIFLLLTVEATARSFEVNGLKYSPIDTLGNVKVLGIKQHNSIVKVPEKVNYENKTYTVTSIGSNAFAGSGIKSIDLPNTIITIENNAFSSCRSLTSIAIPHSVTTIGHTAFQYCQHLAEVRLGSKLKRLGDCAFDGCINLRYVKSYAKEPPKGNYFFPDVAMEKGVLFVPKTQISNYMVSSMWKAWKNIVPLTEYDYISKITLDKKEVNMKATEKMVLTALVEAANPMIKDVFWSSSSEKIVSVDTNGLIEAHGVGRAVVSVEAADGSGVRAWCMVNVLPTLVESVTIDRNKTILKKGRTMILKATVLPEKATDKTISWISSDRNVVSVDKNGVLKAHKVGTVRIKAIANDMSRKVDTISIQVVPPIIGDSNDNDFVTITDAVNTANYAIGNAVTNFNVEAADVNGDNFITLADATGTVDEVLKQPISEVMTPARTLSVAGTINDHLLVDNFDNKTSTVDIRLENTRDYVALQADVFFPKGMALESIVIGKGVAHTHQMVSHRIDKQVIRLAWFNPLNALIRSGNNAIASLMIRTNDSVIGDIQVMNIVASDVIANDYHLTAVGGQNECVSGLEETIIEEDVSIKIHNRTLVIANAQGFPITIYKIDGAMVANWTSKTKQEILVLDTGVYVVKVGKTTQKVVI